MVHASCIRSVARGRAGSHVSSSIRGMREHGCNFAFRWSDRGPYCHLANIISIFLDNILYYLKFQKSDKGPIYYFFRWQPGGGPAAVVHPSAYSILGHACDTCIGTPLTSSNFKILNMQKIPRIFATNHNQVTSLGAPPLSGWSWVRFFRSVF